VVGEKVTARGGRSPRHALLMTLLVTYMLRERVREIIKGRGLVPIGPQWPLLQRLGFGSTGDAKKSLVTTLKNVQRAGH
jgi:hypothetical protein